MLLEEFLASYDPRGAREGDHAPGPGQPRVPDSRRAGYDEYSAAAAIREGYYSFDLGLALVALNSNCGASEAATRLAAGELAQG